VRRVWVGTPILVGEGNNIKDIYIYRTDIHGDNTIDRYVLFPTCLL